MKLIIIIAISLILIGLAAWFEFRTLASFKNIDSSDTKPSDSENVK